MFLKQRGEHEKKVFYSNQKTIAPTIRTAVDGGALRSTRSISEQRTTNDGAYLDVLFFTKKKLSFKKIKQNEKRKTKERFMTIFFFRFRIWCIFFILFFYFYQRYTVVTPLWILLLSVLSAAELDIFCFRKHFKPTISTIRTSR